MRDALPEGSPFQQLDPPQQRQQMLDVLKPLLIARTEGNPFFLQESVRTLVETGVLAGEPGAYHLVQALPGIQMPATVQAVLAARIGRLLPEDKRLLQTAAVIGTDVPLPWLQAIAELPEEALHRSLAHVQAAEFLYETPLFPEREYTIKHALTAQHVAVDEEGRVLVWAGGSPLGGPPGQHCSSHAFAPCWRKSPQPWPSPARRTRVGGHVDVSHNRGIAMTHFIAIQILTALTLMMAFAPVASADLQRYVTADDPVYRWAHVTQTSPQEGIVVHELRLISQVWQGITWQHRLRIIIPQAPQDPPSLALLLVTGTGAAEQEWREALFMARALGAPVALLADLPNQPLFGGLVEDDLLAHTFVQFLTTRDASWPLLLPMVKGVVRAMDAIQAFLHPQRDTPIDGFLVSGASKRGWTAWLTPVVDTRVKAIAPWVYDNLNLAQQLRHQRETWGQFSGQIGEYTERDLPQRLLAGEPGAVELAAIVDPFSYRQHLTVPKLIILATNDRYWPLDALNVYYDALPGERYLLYVANSGHTLQPGRERAIAGLMALFQHTAGRRRLPTLHWEASAERDTLTLALTTDRPPRSVRAWVATALTHDFRDARWEAFEMQTEHHRYVHRHPKRRGHITALFGEVEYAAAPAPFSLSTTVRLFP